MLSVNLSAIDWTDVRYPSQQKVFVPREVSNLPYRTEGILTVSKAGYVYSLSSKSVIWLKFLGLATYLSISGAVKKCKHIGLQILRRSLSKKQTEDLKQTFRLASIARKAIRGAQGGSLTERVEEFALAEIDYHNSNRRDEIDRSRSERFVNGSYIARCMQPLYHVDQASAPKKLQETIESLVKKEAELQKEIEDRNKGTEKRSMWGYFSNLIQTKPYACLSDNEVRNQLSTIQSELTKKKKQLELSTRCHKYAMIAILQQQGLLAKSVKNLAVESETEVECCNILWCRHQKICGLLHRVDICGTSCWAIDLVCCFCCFWPAGRKACLIC